MCASYGLDPRFDAEAYGRALDQQLLESLRRWAERNANATLRPTGKNRRNLSPIIFAGGDGLGLVEAWWGFLVDGAPSKFPSINTRSERLREQPRLAAGRAIVPATNWFEMRASDRQWHDFAIGRQLLGLAAVTRPGRLASGESYTCYSIVMQPAPQSLASVHDRMPVLVPAGFADTWLNEPADAGLIDAAVDASTRFGANVSAAEITARPA